MARGLPVLPTSLDWPPIRALTKAAGVDIALPVMSGQPIYQSNILLIHVDAFAGQLACFVCCSISAAGVDARWRGHKEAILAKAEILGQARKSPSGQKFAS